VFVGVHDIMFDKPASPPVLYEPPLNGLMITFFGVGVLKSIAYKKPITLKQGFSTFRQITD
jgi:hypothetical protein